MPAAPRPPPRPGPQDMLGLMSYRQATLLTGAISVVFAIMILVHEVALEGGFDLRNYVVVAFCFVWLIVDSLLILGTCKRAHFLLLPWMILICMLTPLFVVGIVAGCKVVGSCIRLHLQRSCEHEYHIFGTTEPTAAAAKLVLLVVMMIINAGSILIVYKYFTILSGNAQASRDVDDETEGRLSHKDPIPKSSIRYARFRDEAEPESNMPLCETVEPVDVVEVVKETNT